MGLDVLQSDSDNEPPTGNRLKECLDLVEQSIREVRTISYLLYPPMLEEMGLKTAIPWYLDGFTKRSGIHTTFEVSEDFGRLPRDLELAIFRVLQEGLTNVHRHSESTTAHVRLVVKEGTLILEVTDKGKGVPSEVLQSTQDAVGTLGVGLRGMNERMRQLGGKMELVSTEAGTTIRATIRVEEFGASAALSAA